MQHSFPSIYDIDDVLWAIEDVPEINVVDKGDYKVINYMVAHEGLFPEIIDDMSSSEIAKHSTIRECRGLIFAPDGRLISRPYHKFFNVGQNDETQNNRVASKLSSGHIVLDKMDGSMVRPLKLDRIYWATKMGVTFVDEQVQTYLENSGLLNKYVSFAETMIEDGLTPIFEWMSPENRIVADYGKTPKMVLTAIREIQSGEYLEYEILQDIQSLYGIPIVGNKIDSLSHLESFLEEARMETNSEGYIIRWNDGHMVKVKNEWYLQIHSAKELVTNDRLVVQAIFDENLDDLKSLLPREDLDRVNRMEQVVNENILAYVRDIEMASAPIISSGMSRKEFATAVRSPYKMFMFRYIFDGEKDLLTPVKAHFRKFLTRNVKFDTVRDILLGGM